MTNEEEIKALREENSRLKATLIKDYELHRAEVEAMSAQVKQLTAETAERRLRNKQITERLTGTERLIERLTEKLALDRLDGR
jgi:SMC interacting uncharacterized protein involved in chromosome segregation